MREHKDKLLPNKITLLIIATVSICLIFGSQTAFAQTIVSITPSSSTVQTNQNFSVYINVKPDTSFVGAQLDVDFDNSLIAANNVIEGDLFGGEETLHIFNKGTIDNEGGTISGLYAAILGGTQIDDNGVFAEIEFSSGDHTGYSDLGLSNLILSNSVGEAIEVSVEAEGITIIEPTEEIVPQTENTEASSGSGSGGNSGGSEDVENIDLKEAKSTYVTSNSDISYQFNEQDNPINSISYHSLKTAGQTTSTIEVLKDTSAAVTDNPPGKVYCHVNIWVGKTGYATEANIEEAVIGFSVPKEWLTSNGFDASSIRLNRFNEDKWNELKTSIVEENDDLVFFEAKTPGFSPFAITALVSSEPALMEEADTDERTEDENPEKQLPVSGETAEETQGLGQNSALFLALSLVAVAILRKK
ncbi:PGF-pre-PGF domain-containing protein [Methanolobus sp. ZRKC2]|uniref:PGF-pre-PGF domain-containing protein n=1 Tax=Methanolobus sp. ZRKC2 TaxID=3125783 RepID=UPI0032550E11